MPSSNKYGYGVIRCAGFNGDGYSRPGVVVGEELTPKSQKLEIVKITTLRHWLQKEMEMPKEDESRVFRCAGVSGDAYSSPGLLVGEGIDTQKSKTRNGR
jgi:hypothetical protein